MKDHWNVLPMDRESMRLAQERLDNLIKPVGSFASLEKMVVQAAGVQRKEKPDFLKKGLLSFSSERPSDTLKALAAHAKAELFLAEIQTEIEVDQQAFQLAGELQKKEIGIVGISLNLWREEEVEQFWLSGKDHFLEKSEQGKEKIISLNLASYFYEAAAARGILIMLDGPASLLAGIEAVKRNKNLAEYLISSRGMTTDVAKEMEKQLGLGNGLSTSMKGDGGLGAAFGLTLFDAAICTTQEIATFADAAVEYAYNASSRK